MAKPKQIEGCHMAVASRVRMIREAIGLTQEDLAIRVGFDRTSIANIETGRQRFSLESIETFAKALGTTPKNLMKGVWW